jgi:preprotein translocase subunit Sec63
LALLRRMLNLKIASADSVDPADPESVLEFDLERDVTADGVRRQKNLLFDKYDPEKASNPTEADRFNKRREQIEKAAKELLNRLGAPEQAPAPAEDPFAAPGSRHNPDLDDILG